MLIIQEKVVIYYFLVIIVSGYLLFSERKSDILLIYFISSIVYYLPAFLKNTEVKIPGGVLKYELSSLFYLTLILNLIFILFWSRINDFLLLSKEGNENSQRYGLIIGVIMTYLLLLITIKDIGSLIFSETSNKSDLLENNNRFIIYLKYFSTYIFVCYFLDSSKKKIINTLVILVPSLFIVVFLAHRSFFVIGIISISYYKIYSFKKNRLFFKNKRLIFLGLNLFVVVMMTKILISPLRAGRYDLILYRLTNFEEYKRAIFLGEPAIISANLNEILTSGLSVNFETYMPIIYSNIPFLDELFNLTSSSFNQKFQPLLFSEVNFGMASTFFGEAISNGGWSFYVLIVNILIISLILIQKYLNKVSSIYLKTFLSITLIYLAFYIHRNSILMTVTMIKRYLSIFILLEVGDQFMQIVLKKNIYIKV